MLKEDVRDYKFSDVKHRLDEIDNELTQYESKDDGQNDNILTMMPDIQHKSDADFME